MAAPGFGHHVAVARLPREGGSTMSDSPLEPHPQDDDRINVLVESELVYWTREFRVTRAQLAAAIEQVGPRVGDLRRVLGPTTRQEPG
jgi:hypothetical protein